MEEERRRQRIVVKNIYRKVHVSRNVHQILLTSCCKIPSFPDPPGPTNLLPQDALLRCPPLPAVLVFSFQFADSALEWAPLCRTLTFRVER